MVDEIIDKAKDLIAIAVGFLTAVKLIKEITTKQKAKKPERKTKRRK